jgi:hypothetical protein
LNNNLHVKCLVFWNLVELINQTLFIMKKTLSNAKNNLNLMKFKDMACAVALFTTLAFTTSITAQTTLEVSEDSYVRPLTYADTNYGTANLVTSAIAETEGRLALIKFDISGLSSADITATLKVMCRNSTLDSGNGRDLYKTTSDWTEGAVTYNTKPATGNKIANFLVKAYSTSNWTEIDVTDYVKEQIGLAAASISFMIKAPTASGQGVDFVSKESTVAVGGVDGSLYGPRLEITSTLGVKNHAIGVETFLNPATNELNISLAKSNLNLNKTNASIYSVSGSKVLETKLSLLDTKLDLSKLSSGVYILKVDDQINQVSRKIVIQ